MATTKERLTKAEERTAKLRDKLRHAELIGESELYRKLHKARLAIDWALDELAENDGFLEIGNNRTEYNAAQGGSFAMSALMDRLRAAKEPK